MSSVPLGPGPEFDRIRAIEASLGSAAAGLGDDCAFLPDGWCVSTDLSLEHVHFRRPWLTPREIGWRAAAGALSDLAAVGARAEAVLVGLIVPAGDSAEFLGELMAGCGEAASAVGARIVGGDLTGGRDLGVAVTVLGRTDRPVRRRGAEPGDEVWVTGTLGGARAALTAWSAGRSPAAAARSAFAKPMPRISQGLALAAAGARAMIDLSDGLAGDLGHLAAASGVLIEVEADLIPVHEAVAAEAARLDEAPAVFAARGGEDYELAVALPPGFGGGRPVTRLEEVAFTRIGRVVEGAGVAIRLGGRVVAVEGFDHFR